MNFIAKILTNCILKAKDKKNKKKFLISEIFENPEKFILTAYVENDELIVKVGRKKGNQDEQN